MYKYRLKENSKFKVGDTKIKGGKKSTVTDIDPVTGTVTWSLEDVGAFDTVYKTFDKLNQLVKTLESEGEAESDSTIDSIADQVKKLFNQYRTHIRKNYPEAYERILMVKEDLEIGGKKVKRINKNNSNNPEDYTVEYEDGTSEPYVDTLEESVNEGTFHGPREIAIYDGPDGETYIEKRGLGYYGYNNSFDFEAEDKAELKHKLNSWGYRLVAGSIDEGEGEGYLTPKAFDKNKKSTGANDIYYYKLGYKPVPKKIKGSGLEVKQLFEEDGEGDFKKGDKVSYKDSDGKSKSGYIIKKMKLDFKRGPVFQYLIGKTKDQDPKLGRFDRVSTVPGKENKKLKKLNETDTLKEYSDFQQKRINGFDELEDKLNTLSPLLSNAKSDTAEFYNENPGSYAIVYSTDMVNELLDDIIELLKLQE